MIEETDLLIPSAISRSDQLAAEVFQHRRDLTVELAVPVEDQIPGCTIFGKGLSQLLHDPGTAGMSGDVEVQDVTTAVADYEETVQPGRPVDLHPESPTDPDVNLSIHPARVTPRKPAGFRQDKRSSSGCPLTPS